MGVRGTVADQDEDVHLMRFERNRHCPSIHAPEVRDALRAVASDVGFDSVDFVPDSLHTSGTTRWKAADQG